MKAEVERKGLRVQLNVVKRQLELWMWLQFVSVMGNLLTLQDICMTNKKTS